MEESEKTSERQASPEELESPEVGIKKLQDLLREKEEALASANNTIAQMKKSQDSLDNQVTVLKQKSAALEEKLTMTGGSLKGAVESYRTLVIGANPGVLAELVSGDTIESVSDSLEKAKALVSRVRQGLETEILASRVPLGAPARAAPNLSSLSPREKITYAMGRTP